MTDAMGRTYSFFSLRWTASWKSPSILHACTTFIAHCSAEETMLPRMDGVIRTLSRFPLSDLESCEHTLELPENTPDSREVKPDGLCARLGWRERRSEWLHRAETMASSSGRRHGTTR